MTRLRHTVVVTETRDWTYEVDETTAANFVGDRGEAIARALARHTTEPEGTPRTTIGARWVGTREA